MTLEELFESLSIDAIDRFIENSQEEHLSLDFKTVSGADLRASGDKKNLAEILSGFANSAGGIIIWGVGTQKNAAGNDVASLKKPISAVAAFINRLEEATPLSVTPAIVGVRHRALGLPDGSGFAATYVPESDAGPHMALGGHDRYFKRAGDRFYRMAHYDVADMFGRRQRPSLRLSYSLQKGSSHWDRVSRDEIRVLLTVTNVGRASAVAPYIRLEVDQPFTIGPLGISSQQSGSALVITSEAVQPPSSSLVARNDFVIHPKSTFQVAQVATVLHGDKPILACEVRYAAAALNSVVTEGALRIEPSEIAAVLGRSVEPKER